jgi:DNA-binding CsgD family transcriptional regulator
VLEQPALVGRSQEIAEIGTLLDRATGGLLLFGAAGAGKTRMVIEAAQLGSQRGWQVEWRSVPAGVPDTEDVIGHLPAVGQNVLMCVDDAHRLNDLSAASLFTAVTSGQAVVVVSLLSERNIAESLCGLWKDEICDRRDIGLLDRDHSDQLVCGLLDGLADGVTLARFWQLTQGTPLYLREMVAAGLSSGELSQNLGVWQWQGQMLPAPRLIQLVEIQIGRRPTAVRDALDLVAAGEPVGPDVLARAGADTEALELLEQDGLLEVARVGRRMQISCRHPMIGAAVRASAGPLRSRGLQRRLALSWREFGARADDGLRLGAAVSGSGTCARTPRIQDAVADHQDGQVGPAVREQEARAAVAAGGGAHAAARLGELLSWMQRHEEAEAVLSSYQSQASTDSERVALGGRRAAVLRWGLNRPLDAWKVLDSLESVVRDRSAWPGLTALRQQFLALDETARSRPSRPDEGPRLRVGRVIRGLEAHSEEAISTAAPVCQAFECVARGQLAQATTRWPDGAQGSETTSELADPLDAEQLAYVRTIAHLAGGDIDAAWEIADGRYRSNAEHQRWLSAALWACCLGDIAHARGRLQESLRWMRESAATASTTPTQPHALLLQHIALAGVVRAAAILGDVDAAESALFIREGLRSVPDAQLNFWPDDHIPWLEVARDRPAQAVEAALSTARKYADLGMTGFQVASLHLAARLGGSVLAAEGLPEATGDFMSGDDLPALAVRHIHALANSDARQLDLLSQRFGDMGASLLAAEAAGTASLIYSRAQEDERAAALDASARAHQWISQCEGAITPVLLRLKESNSLTRRQREIAQLAVSGLSSREIATRLFVSVRTVDNALGSIYRKLGVRNRQELTSFLEPFDMSALPL